MKKLHVFKFVAVLLFIVIAGVAFLIAAFTPILKILIVIIGTIIYCGGLAAMHLSIRCPYCHAAFGFRRLIPFTVCPYCGKELEDEM